jgi:MoxR-like ATPase
MELSVTTKISTTVTRKEKLNALMQAMQQGLLEREEQVKLTLLAALAGEHVLLLGPPGTAKSELAKRLKDVFVEANYFERLLTRFSVPEEVFGPLSIKALEEDRYTRMTSGYLPQASVAFIDEIFKANSAILNSLLSVLNERVFDNGNRRDPIDLVSVIAASNELPEGDELTALYDRFMLRSFVNPVSDDSFIALLSLGSEKCDPDLSVRLRLEDLKEVQRLASKVTLTSDVVELCSLFRGYLKKHKIYVSDRRWRKLVKLLQVSAFTNEQNEVSVYDAWLLPHCLWDKPDQLEGLVEFYKKSIAVSGNFESKKLVRELTAWESRLSQDSIAMAQVRNERGDLLFRDENNKPTTKAKEEYQKTDRISGKLLYLDCDGDESDSDTGNYEPYKPSMVERDNEPLIGGQQYSHEYISNCIRQVVDLKNGLSEYALRLQGQHDTLEELLQNHLWVDEIIWPEVSHSLLEAIDKVAQLLERVQVLLEGFENLPREEVMQIDHSEEVIEGELVEEVEGE